MIRQGDAPGPHAAPRNEDGISSSPWLWLAICAGLLAPLAVTPVLPLIDLYNHLARFHVLAHIGEDPFLAQNYAENWRLLPNVGFDYLTVPLVRLLPPLLLAKTIVAAIIAVQFSGVLYLNKVLTGRINSWTVLLATALSYSFILNWGFINYLLGAGLLLWALAIWVRWRNRPLLATAACSVLATLIFLTHGFAFGVYGLMLGGIEFGLWLLRPQRRWTDLAGGAALLALQAVAPAVLFLNTTTSQAQSYHEPITERVQRFAETGTFGDRLSLQIWTRAESLLRVAETPWPALDAVLFIITATLLACAVWRGWLGIARVAIPALVLVAILFVVMPGALFGASHLYERMPLMFCLLLAASLHTRSESQPAARRCLLALLAIITILRLFALCLGWSIYRQDYEAFHAVTKDLKPHSVLATELVLGNNRRDGMYPRCQMYGPLAVIEKQAAAMLFASPAQQPMVLRGRLRAYAETTRTMTGEVEAMIRLSRLPFHYDEDVATIASGRKADYLFMCGADRLKRALPSNLEPIARRGNLSLYRIQAGRTKQSR